MAARRVVMGLWLAVLALLGWLLLAPQQLGGPVAVVTTYGDSMLPTYTASDLVVVVEAGDYDVGDIVAYRSEELGGAVVLHRIVDVGDDGYVTSGDNNDWLDPDRPTDDELMGTARLRVPGAGRLLEVPTPLRAAAVTGLAALALFGSRRRGRRDRARRRGGTGGALAFRGHRRTAPDDRLDGGDDSVASDTARSSLAWTGWPGTVAAVGGALALAGAALGLAAFVSPDSVQGQLTYTHRGTFDYTTPAPAGLVYPEGEVTTGEPVFLRLVDTLDLVFTHELEGPDEGAQATGRLWLELADEAGWSHRTPLSDEQEATDEPLVLEAVLDVPNVRDLIEEIREEAGVGGAGGRIDVTAEVEVTAPTAGQELADRFSPTLTFDLDEQRLVPRIDEEDGFTTTEEGSVTVEGAESARLEVAGRGLDVADARMLAVAAFALGLLALAVGAAGALRHRGLGEAERLRLRYGSRLVEVDSLRAPANHGLVIVRDMPTLVSLAEQAERPILHHQDEGLHTYVVEDETTQYHYRVETPSPAPPATDAPPDARDDATQVDDDAGPQDTPDLEDQAAPQPEDEPAPVQPEPSGTPEQRPEPAPEAEPTPDPATPPVSQPDDETWWADIIDDGPTPSDEELFPSSVPVAEPREGPWPETGPWVARPRRRSPEPTTPPPGAPAREPQPLEPDQPRSPASSDHRARLRARRGKRIGESRLFRRRDADPPDHETPDST